MKRRITINLAVDYLRRFLLAFIITLLYERKFAQLLLIMYINQAYMTNLAYTRIYADRKILVIEILNEIIILLTVY